ncbi:MAG TPA: helix-turn-helix domain-containing protein [Longimicrobium sp.]|nr:helix-turn-helix domain-containing protein [Longimicrobium sp.]
MKSRMADAARLYVSGRALSWAAVPPHLRTLVRTLDTLALAAPVGVVCASELVVAGGPGLGGWAAASDARYLVLIDVPEPALARLPHALGLHRPDYRLYPTYDQGALRRLLVGLARREPVLGVVHAYVLGPDLFVLTADFELRCFPLRKIPSLVGLKADERAAFVIDPDGSYLRWPAHDLHLGVSQLLQEVDPAFMTDLAIQRNERDRVGPALRAWREELGLRQADVPGLGERQVSRIETGVSRLTFDAARKFARAFGMEAGLFLDELARRTSAPRERVTTRRPGKRSRVGAGSLKSVR